jgi:hypothetical protein
MAKLEDEFKINIETKDAQKKIKKVASAIKKLQIEIDKLKTIEIGIKVVTIKKKWWQFWL